MVNDFQERLHSRQMEVDKPDQHFRETDDWKLINGCFT